MLLKAHTLFVTTILLAVSMLIVVPSTPAMAQDEALCTSTGGSWGVVGIDGGAQSLGCVCPGGSSWTAGQGCVASTTDTDSGGLQGFESPETGDGNTNCGGVPLSVDVGCDPATDDPISGYLSGIINFLAGGVVVVVTAMIIMGGFQYIWAHGSPDLIQKAKKQITNAVIALLTFIFIYAFLQWLIPGGLFNRPQADPGCNPNTEVCDG